MKSIYRQQGFTLIEVMVALFIFSVGILGIISLQLFAKQNNYDAIQRTTASALASSIVEKMRINSGTIGSYLGTAEPVADTAIPTTCSTSPGCSPNLLAQHDLQEWYSLISGATENTQDATNAGGLTAPSACITRDPLGKGSSGDNEYRVTIAWRGRSAISNPTADTCGEDAVDGSGELIYGTDNKFRRIFVIDAKIE